VVERHKRNAVLEKTVGAWFWRTYDQQEIDYIEEDAGRLLAAEFKWKTGKAHAFPKAWTEHYPEAENLLVTPETFRAFLT
jgi:hypothetical protein